MKRVPLLNFEQIIYGVFRKPLFKHRYEADQQASPRVPSSEIDHSGVSDRKRSQTACVWHTRVLDVVYLHDLLIKICNLMLIECTA